MFNTWRLCECCAIYVATNMLKDNHLCRTCFMQLKTVDVQLEKVEAIEEKKAHAKVQIEIEKLNYWWALSEGNGVGR
jgi:hypothetical protein